MIKIRIVQTLNKVVPSILGETQITNPNANVDLVSIIIKFYRIYKTEYYTTFFGWARTAGIGAQILERMVLETVREFQYIDQNILLKDKNS